VAVVEIIVFEEHDVCREEGILQLGTVYVAKPYAAQSEEAILELGMEALGDDAGRGEAAGNGSGVKLAIEYATIEMRVVGRMKEVVEETASEHEGEKGARRRGRRVMVDRIDDAVFHCVLEEDEEGRHECS